jgi:hypothetical protein
VGDEVAIDNTYRARVERLDGLRIAQVRLLPPASQPTSTDERPSTNGRLHTSDQ